MSAKRELRRNVIFLTQYVLGSALAEQKHQGTRNSAAIKLCARCSGGTNVLTLAQDALEVTQRLVDLADDLFGRKHGVYASALNDQALMLKSVGELAAATDTYLKALEVKRKRVVDALVYVGEGTPTYENHSGQSPILDVLEQLVRRTGEMKLPHCRQFIGVATKLIFLSR